MEVATSPTCSSTIASLWEVQKFPKGGKGPHLRNLITTSRFGKPRICYCMSKKYVTVVPRLASGSCAVLFSNSAAPYIRPVLYTEN